MKVIFLGCSLFILGGYPLLLDDCGQSVLNLSLTSTMWAFTVKLGLYEHQYSGIPGKSLNKYLQNFTFITNSGLTKAN